MCACVSVCGARGVWYLHGCGGTPTVRVPPPPPTYIRCAAMQISEKTDRNEKTSLCASGRELNRGARSLRSRETSPSDLL